jgi:hypothetical protein
MEDYRLLNLEGGNTYAAEDSNLPGHNHPRIVFKGTSSRFYVVFQNLPENISRFHLLESDCTGGSFCFYDINLNDYRKIDDFDIDSYAETNNEGTAMFYTSIQCGEEGALSLRLPVGIYKYTATNKRRQWNGTLRIVADGCNKQYIR